MNDYQNKNLFQAPATVAKIETLADRSLKLKVITQELNEEQSAMVFKLYNKLGWFVFSEQSIKPEDIKDLPEIQLDEGEKSPSQRMRAALFVYWEQQKIQEPFDIFYRRQVEKWISQIKEKLN